MAYSDNETTGRLLLRIEELQNLLLQALEALATARARHEEEVFGKHISDLLAQSSKYLNGETGTSEEARRG